METVCMKCPILFSGENEKIVVALPSAELAQRVVKVKLAIGSPPYKMPENIKCIKSLNAQHSR